MLIFLWIKWRTSHTWLRENTRDINSGGMSPSDSVVISISWGWIPNALSRSLPTRIAGISSRITKTRSPRSNTGPTLVRRRRVKWVEDSAMQVLSATTWSICIGSSTLFSFNETPRSLNFLKSFWGVVVVKAPESREQGNQRHFSTKARSSSADLNIIAAIFRAFPLDCKIFSLSSSEVSLQTWMEWPLFLHPQ